MCSPVYFVYYVFIREMRDLNNPPHLKWCIIFFWKWMADSFVLLKHCCDTLHAVCVCVCAGSWRPGGEDPAGVSAHGWDGCSFRGLRLPSGQNHHHRRRQESQWPLPHHPWHRWDVALFAWLWPVFLHAFKFRKNLRLHKQTCHITYFT